MNELHTACAEGKLHKVIESLVSGHNLNAWHTESGASPLCYALQNGHFDVAQHLFSLGAKIALAPQCTGKESIFTWVNECKDSSKRIRLLTWLRDNETNPLAFAGECPFSLAHANLALALQNAKNNKARKRLCDAIQLGDDGAYRLAADFFRMEVLQTPFQARSDVEATKCNLGLSFLASVATKTPADLVIEERLYFYLIVNKNVRTNLDQYIGFTLSWVECMTRLQPIRKFDDRDLFELAYHLNIIGNHFKKPGYLQQAVAVMQQITKASDETNGKLAIYLIDYADYLSDQDQHNEAIEAYKNTIATLEKIRKMTDTTKHRLAASCAKLGLELFSSLEKPDKPEKRKIEKLFARGLAIINDLLSKNENECSDTYNYSLAMCSLNFADILFAFDKNDKAEFHYLASLAAFEAITVKTNEHQRTQVKAHRELGVLLYKRGAVNQAVSRFKLALFTCVKDGKMFFAKEALAVCASAIHSQEDKNLAKSNPADLKLAGQNNSTFAEIGIRTFKGLVDPDKRNEEDYFICLRILKKSYYVSEDYASAVAGFQAAMKDVKQFYLIACSQIWLACFSFELLNFTVGFDYLEAAIASFKTIDDEYSLNGVIDELRLCLSSYSVRKANSIRWSERVAVFMANCFHDAANVKSCIDDFYILYSELTNRIPTDETIEAFALLKRLMSLIMRLADEDSSLLDEDFKENLRDPKNRATILSLLQADLEEEKKKISLYKSKITLFDSGPESVENDEVFSCLRFGMNRET